MATVIERLSKWSAREGNGCLTWRGARVHGYGTISISGAKRRVHRVAWEIARGPIPGGMAVCHRCDNRACIDVDHLFLGTLADNNADMMNKGRFVPVLGEKNGRAKLTPEQVAAIVADPRGRVAIAAEYGISKYHVNALKRRRNWKHLPAASAKVAA
jgi:hypothetical protein